MAQMLGKMSCFGNVRPTVTLMMCISLWLLVFAMQPETSECRYLPTRSHGDDLDKLRELMLQILESSNEEPRSPSEASGNGQMSHRAAWLNKLGGPADNLEMQRKYGANGLYESNRFY